MCVRLCVSAFNATFCASLNLKQLYWDIYNDAQKKSCIHPSKCVMLKADVVALNVLLYIS